MINIGLQSISLVLIYFLERLFGGAKINNNDVYCAGADLHPFVNNSMLTQ